MKKYQELITQCRDVMIVIFGFTYMVGIILFGIHYSRYNLGAITPPAMTYFVFGSGFTLLILPMFILSDGAISVCKQDKPATKFSVAATCLSWTIAGMSLWVLVRHDFLKVSAIFSSLWRFVLLCFLLPAAVTIINVIVEKHTSAWKHKWHLVYDVLSITLSGLAVVLASVFLVSIVFPNVVASLPQELGGIKTKCAQLDIATRELSEQTKSLLGIHGQASEVITTQELEIVFHTGDQVWIKVSGESLQVNQGAIRAIKWVQMDKNRSANSQLPACGGAWLGGGR